MIGTTDAHGNTLTATTDAASTYDSAIDHLLRYRPELIDDATVLLEYHADTPMTQVLGAYLCLMSTDAADLAGAVERLEALVKLETNPRESAHRDVITAWSSGDWRGASTRLDHLSTMWPTDVLALLIGHQLDFFLGDAGNLRDRIGRCLGAVSPDHPHHGFVLGMQAFGLEEAGHYEAAEQAGYLALQAHPDDVWAVHAVTHAYEMRGQVDRGIRFLDERRDDWSVGNMFTVHNWWHYALFLLEAERTTDALAVYDAHIHNDSSAGVPMEMLDASALLWRLLIDGHDTGDRFELLADAWSARSDGVGWYAFNDLHATMAYIGAGRLAEAAAVIDQLATVAAEPADQRRTNQMMTAEVGLPACRAVLAFAEGRHGDVVDLLAPIRRAAHRFGGSHAQRDALRRTLLESALLSGQHELATALARERLSTRDTDVFAWRRMARLSANSVAADAATERATTLARSFAAALPA
jgi:hypothetical protein